MSVSTRKIEVLKPTGRAKLIEEKPLPGIAGLENKVIGFLDNRKPNFALFLDRLETLLLNDYNVARVVRKRKSGSSAFGGVLLDELAKDCAFVVVGSCD